MAVEHLLRRAPLSLLALLALAACGGGSSPTNPGSGGGGGETPTEKADPSFASDITPIFARYGCNGGGCHGSSAPQAGLTLTSSAAYQNLVDVQAQSENFLRVKPGDANNSYLVIKLEGRQNVGVRMPNGGGPIDAVDLANIKNWINQGAKQN